MTELWKFPEFEMKNKFYRRHLQHFRQAILPNKFPAFCIALPHLRQFLFLSAAPVPTRNCHSQSVRMKEYYKFLPTMYIQPAVQQDLNNSASTILPTTGIFFFLRLPSAN